MQKMAGSPSPVMSVTATPMIASTSLPSTTTLKSTQPTKIVQTQTIVNAQPSQQMTQQFLPVQSSSQPTTANQFASVYSLNSTSLTQSGTLVSTQNVVPPTAQTTVVSQIPQITQVSTLITQASTVTTPVATNTQGHVATQSSRQVKVIKTIPHLQPVVSNKPMTQMIQQQPLQQSSLQVVQQSPLVHQIPQIPSLASTATPQALVSQQSINVPPAMTTVTAMAATTTTPAVVVTSITTTASSSTSNVASSVKTAEQGQYLCEWRSCMRYGKYCSNLEMTETQL